MAAMTEERDGDCSYTVCGGSCPPNKVETYKIPAQCGSGTFQRRCCSPQYYPDVLIMIDKGAGSIMQSVEHRFDLQYADYSLLEDPFTNARLVKALPGELECSCAGSLLEFARQLVVLETITIITRCLSGYASWSGTEDLQHCSCGRLLQPAVQQ